MDQAKIKKRIAELEIESHEVNAFGLRQQALSQGLAKAMDTWALEYVKGGIAKTEEEREEAEKAQRQAVLDATAIAAERLDSQAAFLGFDGVEEFVRWSEKP